MNKREVKEILLVVFITLLVVIGLFLRTDRMIYSHQDFIKQGWDHHVYIDMATNHLSHIAPFEYRILNPLLAKLLPFDLLINFTILSFIFLWLTGIITYFMLKKLEFSSQLALTGSLFFLSLGWATRFNIYDFWLTDPLAFLFIVATMHSIFAKKDLFFMLLLSIGVTAKENVIFVAPLYYTFNNKKYFDSEVLFRFLCLVLPAILILFAIRMLYPITNTQEYNVVTLLQTIGLSRIKNLSIDKLYSYSIGTFGISLIFLPLFSIRQNLFFLLKFSPFIVLTYSSLLFAVNTERVIVSSFPSIIVMSLYGIKNIANRTGVYEKFFILLPLCLVSLLLINKDWHYIIPSIYEAMILLLFLALSLQSRKDVTTYPPRG